MMLPNSNIEIYRYNQLQDQIGIEKICLNFIILNSLKNVVIIILKFNIPFI